MYFSTLTKAFEAWDNYYRLNMKYGRLYQENRDLEKVNDKLSEENTQLRAENKDYRLLQKAFGRSQLNELVERAKAERKEKRDRDWSR